MPIRTTFYIDGFNFYNGLKTAKKANPIWGTFYWLDLVKFCQSFLSENHELVCVKYFTASPIEEGKKIRQSQFFRANKYLNGDKIQFIKGKYYKKPIICRGTCKETFNIYEEKRTDVNISVEIMGDCAFSKTDLIVLISADSDLVPTMEYVIKNFKDQRIKIYFPPCRQSYDLKQLAGGAVELMNNKLKFQKAIMAETVTLGEKSVTKPVQW